LSDDYPELMHFIGSILCIYGSTARVESDFSILKYVKEVNQSNLSYVCMEGPLLARQWDTLENCGNKLPKNALSHSVGGTFIPPPILVSGDVGTPTFIELTASQPSSGHKNPSSVAQV